MMMRFSCVTVCMLLCLMVLSGCGSSDLVIEKLDVDEVDRIQVVLAMGNPRYGADSRIITDREEIEMLVEALNGATIGNRVADMDLAVAEASRYLLYSGGDLIQQFWFNGNDSERVWHQGAYHYVTYQDKTPYELYRVSEAEVIVVDEDLNEMERGED